jgi:deoxyribodipyrimidine photo-lyase
MTAPVLLWLRRELRLADNRALAAALATGRKVLPVFVLDEVTPGAWAPGGAGRWWLHMSLASLAADLRRAGTPLVLRRGRIGEVLPRLMHETGACAIHAGQPVEPWARAAVAEVREAIPGKLHLHRTATLFDPDEIRTQAGGPYGVYTPFSRACLARFPPEPPLPAPAHIPAPTPPASDRLDDWGLLPTRPDWAGGLRATWTPGESGAAARLAAFTGGALADYAEARDLPGLDGTSMLSPHLHFGEISATQLCHAASRAGSGRGPATFINEVLWREFSTHLLWHHPALPERPLRPAFAHMPWRHDADALGAWQRGRTGLPIVDAGMRQLWQTGWMHNRVRMITASLLVKHLLVPWQDGEAWFWDTLVDADLASNAASWQWVAGSGADAAPFFRIFNPVLQGRKFDPSGAYVRRFVPELARLPDRWLHEPWGAPDAVLAAAGVRIGRTYPAPIVDLATGRARALAAFETITGSAS